MEAEHFNGFDGYEGMKVLNERFLDKDGFAFPAPKGPPKPRMNYSAPEEKDYEELGGHLDFKTSSTNIGETENLDEKETEDMTRKQPSERGAASSDSRTRTVKDLVTNFINEASNLQNEWSDILSQSEDFETRTLQKIEAYMDKSNQKLEELDRQKNTLSHRMRGISGILQDFK